jgi:hypothetical protein
MLQEPKSGKAIIAAVSGIVLVVFSAAAILDSESLVVPDAIIDFLSSFLKRFLHENERQIVDAALTWVV